MSGSKPIERRDMKARMIFILVCASLVAVYLQAVALGPVSWFDGR
jgi:hypothetical protein